MPAQVTSAIKNQHSSIINQVAPHPMIAAILTTLLFSLSALSGRRLTDHLPGPLANLTRLLLAAAVLGVYAHVWGAGVGGPGFTWLFASGCVGFGVGDLALFQA